MNGVVDAVCLADTSNVDVDGTQVQSVSGGGHWGERVILPEQWIDLSVTPCALNPIYGLFWWLNTDGSYQPSAPRNNVFAIGAGGNVTWIDPTHRIVAVLRWIDSSKLDAWIGQVLAAITV